MLLASRPPPIIISSNSSTLNTIKGPGCASPVILICPLFTVTTVCSLGAVLSLYHLPEKPGQSHPRVLAVLNDLTQWLTLSRLWAIQAAGATLSNALMNQVEPGYLLQVNRRHCNEKRINRGCLIHGVFIVLHIVALMLGLFGLIITIPLHIIVYLLMKKKNEDTS